MVGSVLASALAWAILPQDIHWHFYGLTYSSWRLYVAAASLPALLSAVSIFFAPESPRYCLLHNKMPELRKTLSDMYIANTGRDMPMDLEVIPIKRDLLDLEGKQWYTIFFDLFDDTLRRSTVCLLIIWFTLSFGYYGFTLWMPSFFSTIQLPEGFNVYISVFVSNLANIPGNVLSLFSVDIIGRKQTLGASMIISALSVFLIYMIKNGTSVIIMSCLFAGLSIPAWNALDILSAELFPTKSRATAMGFIMIVGRLGAILGNLVFGEFIELSEAIPLVTSAVCLFIGGITCFFLAPSEHIDLIDDH